MDPNKAHERLNELAARILNGDCQEWADLTTAAEELAETFVGLDDWISRGGFLPSRWMPGRIVCQNTMKGGE